jgi:hypothetical protein
MELSVLCDVKVFLFVYDRNADTKLLHYQSSPNDDYIDCIYRDCCNPKNFYCNEHYHNIGGKSNDLGVISSSGGDISFNSRLLAIQ